MKPLNCITCQVTCNNVDDMCSMHASFISTRTDWRIKPDCDFLVGVNGSLCLNMINSHLVEVFLEADATSSLVHWLVLVQLHPPCTQEYKWRELEEQRQAQKLQKQLQQEQAYLLSLQQNQNQNQNLDSSTTAHHQSTKPSQGFEPERVKPLKTESDALKQPPSTDFEKTRPSPVSSLENPTEPKLPVADLHGPAPDCEPVQEVNRHADSRRSSLLVWTLLGCAGLTWWWLTEWTRSPSHQNALTFLII